MVLSAANLGVAILVSLFTPPSSDTARKATSPRMAALPPVIVVVEAAPGISSSLISRTLAEAREIWRIEGITFEWHVTASFGQKDEPCSLRVMINDDVSTRIGRKAALGSITFTTPDTPEPIIHVSRANVLNLITMTPGVRDMPLLWRETLVGRALGRALAHELGHYLLGSPGHTERGLMQGTRSARDFFSAERRGFDLTPEQRDVLVRHVSALFTELAKHAESRERLAGRLGLHPRSAHDFLDALVALGFLQRDGEI